MNTWKVILATLIIYGAGLLTGALVFKGASRPVTAPTSRTVPVYPGSDIFQERFFERMKKDLQLTPEQTQRLESIFRESRERMKTLWEIVNPEVKGELQAVREKINNELTPGQREKFEVLLKTRRHGPGQNPPAEVRPRDHHPSGTRNQPRRPGEPMPSAKPPVENAPASSTP